MNSRKILKILGIAVVVIILLYSFMPGSQLSYEETVLQHRQEIREFLKHDDESPLSDSLKQVFQDLIYYEPNPEFKVRASLELIPGNPLVRIPASDGQIHEYIRYAFAHFELDGAPYKVTLLKPVSGPDQDRLFLPFGDLTNGKTTYGGGRYIDLESTTRNRVTIDFNLAYNPYCVYSTDYSCPLPPAENQLQVAIEAGVKNHLPTI